MDKNSGITKKLKDGKTLSLVNVYEHDGGIERHFSYLFMQGETKTIIFPGKQYYKEFTAEEVLEWYNKIDSEDGLMALAEEIYFTSLKE
jgi:hypothetical protein